MFGLGDVTVEWEECSWTQPHPPHTWQSVEEAVTSQNPWGIFTKISSCTGAGQPDNRCKELGRLAEGTQDFQCVYEQNHLGVHLAYNEEQRMMIWPVPPMKVHDTEAV